MRFRDRLIRFMYGRNGFDKLGQVVLWTGILISVINMFVGSVILMLANYVILFYCFFRVFSRNVYKRRAENVKFLKLWSKFIGFFKLRRNKFRDRKTHVYRKCPSCKALLRLPRSKGEHTVRCPRCSTRFETKV